MTNEITKTKRTNVTIITKLTIKTKVTKVPKFVKKNQNFESQVGNIKAAEEIFLYLA